MEGRSDVDRISKLPEPILQHILSFLVAKDGARMSTMSKVWDSAWNSLSYLNFGDKFLNSEDMPRLVNVVNQSLANSLPDAIFAAKALNVLRLDGFNIELPCDCIKFSSLRELRLSDVFLNEEFIQSLCTNCCNLEDLYLQNFDGLTSFRVGNTSLPKMKKVNLEFCPFVFQLVDIAAINLEDLQPLWESKGS
ncbi:PREDICTED: FBD-associated F-box protein At5g18780-like [Nicotiana attenuata]|uniref:FBD-associated F-box protein At5g18780-like n=1 Tax=Nicotiana attenuata TaxID=49451 RepID=UPI000904C350|nr:PREDICTED: FBD-associated F-box protein At5g18780-like [Nicotiana attenuata]